MTRLLTMLSSIAPQPYILVLTGAGLLITLVAWLPLAIKRLPLSLPIICIAIGSAIFALPDVKLTEQVERIAMMVLLILFGGALINGLLQPMRWQDWLAAIAIIIVVRPAAGMIGLLGLQADMSEKLTLAFFGIRGVGSFYYLAYALNQVEFGEAERLWGIVGVVALLSIVLHGLIVTPIMRSLDRKHGRDPDTPNTPPPGLKEPALNGST